MKPIIFMSILLPALATGEAMAVCQPNPDGVRVGALNTLLQGYTVCKASDKPGWGWEWQEFHSGSSGQNNNLIDFKKGPPAPGNTDPTKAVGKWTIIGGRTPTVAYDYGTGNRYTFAVYSHGAGGAGPYDFCNSAPGGDDVLGATLLPGQVSCGTPP